MPWYFAPLEWSRTARETSPEARRGTARATAWDGLALVVGSGVAWVEVLAPGEARVAMTGGVLAHALIENMVVMRSTEDRVRAMLRIIGLTLLAPRWQARPAAVSPTAK